ncbi:MULTISPECIES: CvfB family protein [Flavobacterium]|uniref:GntR family transcriptional regulator n=2 Tax=Flavobacterium TaxID=237 RepID=A0AA94F4W5_9FLAO|nr:MULTISPECIES: S1-like domain-containing RNA-binding protein [Flavobacterium]OXA75100.1 GntR family transcriptional regulator [Flavobacterium columnare NBRC 100251 = ATCC 23463]AMA48543.1 GntR family transcriptional regulator [Flavobacterium covae]AND65329.1 GntR family transcriptional regulator [Flavobacterium covae]MCH4830493.1 GntR family transcriptional regulator [Flavobacterium columnare]MCH4833570.1 GntR family transcriptional regulator [Flavobacterium columnare]
MIEIGKYNTLKIARNTNVGLYLTDGEKDVLLPNKYVPKEYEIEADIEVFIYLDHEERPVATTLEPYIFLNEFSLLRVNYVNKFGAFMDWGLEKDLFVPFKEQARPMEEGKRYLVYMYLDKQTNRLVGSSRLNQFLNNQNLNVEKGEEVDLIVSHISDTGINVIINEKHKGLIYKDQIFEDLRTGDRIIGYIKNIRPDGKIDISRQPLGFERIDASAQKILEELKAGRGMLKLHDNSSPEDIKTILQMSKKTFKKAIGTLYREKIIELRPDGIYLLKS